MFDLKHLAKSTFNKIIRYSWQLIQVLSVGYCLLAFLKPYPGITIFSNNIGILVAVGVISISFWKFSNKLDNTNLKVNNIQDSLHSVQKFNNSIELEKAMYDCMQKNKEDIIAIDSTIIQSDTRALKGFEGYFSKVYDIFKDCKQKPLFNHFFQIPPKISISDIATDLYEWCFKPLGQSGYEERYMSSKIYFKFDRKPLHYPFINFTLLKYKDGSSQVFYGWYVIQIDLDIAKSLKDEAFVSSTHPTICQTYSSIMEILDFISLDGNETKTIAYHPKKTKESYILEINELKLN